jgi:pimeloyl-ACP methyl ester carboxylesterase
MKYYLRLFLILMILMSPSLMLAQSDELTNLARATVQLLAEGNYKTVYASFDETMKSNLPTEKLQETWESLLQDCGPYKRQTTINIEPMDQYFIVSVTCLFEKIAVDVQFTFTTTYDIAGLYFVPTGNTGKAPTMPPKRLQVPLRPYPYDEREVTYKNSKTGVKLAGTLTLPRVKGKVPVVLLISGSGQQDRNETILGHQPFLILADYLTRRGIAVLRVDDQGIGGSTGNFEIATGEDLAGDVLAGVEYLKKQPKINPQKIGLIGHSEGGLIAPMVAVKSKDVAFIILLAGPGIPGEQSMAAQLAAMLKARGKNNRIIERDLNLQKSLFAIVKQEKDNSNAEGKIREVLTKYVDSLTEAEKQALGAKDSFIKIQTESVLKPWIRFYISYDPRLALSKVICPVLALYGSKDTQFEPRKNMSEIQAALKKGANKDFVVKELPNLNHLFQTCQNGSPDEYRKIEETIAPSVLQIIGDWIINHSKKN